jgi:multiple sugar transport system ATP-binding protein
VLDHGLLVQVGSPREVYENPQSAAVAARLGSPRINLVPRAALPAVNAPASATTLGVRAEHLHVHSDGAALAHPLRAQVRRIEILSDQRLVHLALADGEHELVSAAPSAGLLESGSTVGLELRQTLWFDAGGRRVGV